MLKTFMIALLFAGGCVAQFRLESESPGESEFGIPKGRVIVEDEVNRFTSEDGTIEFTEPRTDIVKPSVQASFANGVYTYIITNDSAAKRAIGGIRIVKRGQSINVKEVKGDRRFWFSGDGWIQKDSGLAPGQTVTLSISAEGAKQGRVELQFMNIPPVGSVTLPDNIPYGLSILMDRHHATASHVSVMVAGPEPVGQP